MNVSILTPICRFANAATPSECVSQFWQHGVPRRRMVCAFQRWMQAGGPVEAPAPGCLVTPTEVDIGDDTGILAGGCPPITGSRGH